MDTHKNAPLTPKGREAMVRIVIEGGMTKAAAARQFNTTTKTVAKWVERFHAEGVDELIHSPWGNRLAWLARWPWTCL
jgi:transposase